MEITREWLQASFETAIEAGDRDGIVTFNAIGLIAFDESITAEIQLEAAKVVRLRTEWTPGRLDALNDLITNLELAVMA